MKNRKKIEKSMLRFQYSIYFLSCVLLFILLYVGPVIIDYNINGYSSLLAQKDLSKFAQTPFEALSLLTENWFEYINPFSNYLVRFFIFTAVFGALFEVTKHSYKKLKSKNGN